MLTRAVLSVHVSLRRLLRCPSMHDITSPSRQMLPAITVCCHTAATHHTTDDRERLFTFPFLPIPMPNFVTNSHSHGIPTGLFSLLPFPIPEQSFNRCNINNYGPSKTQTVHCLLMSLKLITAARITLYCITFQHN